MRARWLIAIAFTAWLTITTGLALFVNQEFFVYEGVFVLAWALLGLLFWMGGVFRPGRSR